MNIPEMPNAKFDNLVMQEFSDEILIYNLKTNRACSLNNTSALIWRHCNGNNDISQIAKIVENNINQKVTEELVWLALDQLKKEGLIDFAEGDLSRWTGINRRKVIKKIGLASMIALPVISSVIAPKAANAASLVCDTCITSLGIGQGTCSPQCSSPTVMCVCFGNNSCMGAGQAGPNGSCEDCRVVGTSNMNNSARCIG